LVGRWGVKESTEEIRDLLRASGADHVGTTLVETREQIQQVSHLESMSSPDPLPREVLPGISLAPPQRTSSD
jgi:hypothetical protein